MLSVDEYAVELVVDGSESLAEDDMNEEEKIYDELHPKACEMAVLMAHAIRDNRDAFLAWVRPLVRP